LRSGARGAPSLHVFINQEQSHEQEARPMNDLIKSVLDNRLNTPMNRRRFIQGASGLATLTVLGVPGGGAFAEGKLGGPLNFFGYDGEQGPNVTKEFLEKNGIQLNAAFAGAADETLTRFKTGGRGSMDIMTMNKDFQRSVIDAKVELFQPLDLSRIPNAAGLFAGFKDANWLVRDGKTYGVPMIWGDEPCIWNPQKWDGVPDRYTDFADEKYKGELVLLDDPFGNIWLFAKSIGVKDPSRLTKADLDRAVEAMLTIKPNVAAIGASLGDMADIMIRGPRRLGLPDHHRQGEGRRAGGRFAEDRRPLLLVGCLHHCHRRAQPRQRIRLHRLHHFRRVECEAGGGARLGLHGREGL
jgi:spermidine/putrescine transport system substrate-binding protein